MREDSQCVKTGEITQQSLSTLLCCPAIKGI